MSRRAIGLVTGVLMCAAVVLAPARAQAVERQWRLGADAGFAAFAGNDGVYPGWGLGAHLAYGLTDSYDLLVESGVTAHSVDQASDTGRVANLGVGVAYSLDIVQWVPYFGLLIGGYRMDGGLVSETKYDAGLQAALGFDYRFSPSWATGVQLRYHTFSDDPFSAHYATMMLRFEYVTGW